MVCNVLSFLEHAKQQHAAVGVNTNGSFALFATNAPSHPYYKSPYLLLPYAASFPDFKKTKTRLEVIRCTMGQTLLNPDDWLLNWCQMQLCLFCPSYKLILICIPPLDN